MSEPHTGLFNNRVISSNYSYDDSGNSSATYHKLIAYEKYTQHLSIICKKLYHKI